MSEKENNESPRHQVIYNTLSKDQPRGDVAVCLKPITFFEKIWALKLVEWIEMLRKWFINFGFAF